MNERETMIWAAGVFEGCGVVASNVRQGPTRMYHQISLLAVTGNPEVNARLIDAFGNGIVIEAPSGDPCFSIDGYAAVRGILEEVWKFLTPHTRRVFNAELKRFKMLGKGQIGS